MTLSACGGGGGGAKAVTSAARQLQHPQAGSDPMTAEVIEAAEQAANTARAGNTGDTEQSGQATETDGDTIPEALATLTDILESVSTGNTGPSANQPGSNLPPTTNPPAATAPQTAASGYDFTTRGAPSTQAGALAALGEAYNPLYSAVWGLNYSSPGAPLTASRFAVEIASQDTFQASSDTRAYEAWAQGWTGKGVKVGHLDDFITAEFPPWTHGAIVRFVLHQVAPEINYGTRQITFGCDVPDQQQFNEMRLGYDHFAANGYHIVNNSFAAERYDDGVECGTTPRLLTAPEWRTLIDDAAGQNVFLRFSQSAAASGSYDADMLFVFGAGNEGAACREGLAGCNLNAALIKRLRDNGDRRAGERVLFVGALADGTDTIAGYTITAGEDMKNDFMVTYDDLDSYGDAEGTSLTAPRVAGAAALVRHKFPNLDGAALKQVLLQTADDLGQSGVDSVYGHGKLNILNALSPVGRVTSR